jgi:hypothetical protein
LTRGGSPLAFIGVHIGPIRLFLFFFSLDQAVTGRDPISLRALGCSLLLNYIDTISCRELLMGGVSKLFIARDMEIQATKRFDPFPIVVVDFEQNDPGRPCGVVWNLGSGLRD